jgi:hypothetical protein
MEQFTDTPKIRPELYTVDEFYDRYGAISGFGHDTLGELWGDALSHYTDKPPYEYHKDRHPVDVVWEAMRLADEVEANSDEVLNRRVLIGAALWHDANVHLDAPEECATKEAYSAALFEQSAPKYGYDDDETALVQTLIMATIPGSIRLTVAERLIVRADIANIGSEYRHEFLKKSAALYRERRAIMAEKGTHLSKARFLNDSLRALSRELNSDLSLGDYEREGVGGNSFAAHAGANLLALVSEIAKEQRTTSEDIVRSLSSKHLTRLFRRMVNSGHQQED